MKKYLLSVLLGFFSFVGFTSAGTVSCITDEYGDFDCGGNFGVPEYIFNGFTPGNYVNFSNFVGNCSYQLSFSSEDEEDQDYVDFSSNTSFLIPSYTYYMQLVPPDSIEGQEGVVCSFDYSYSSSVVNPDEGGSGITPIFPGIIAGGTSAFSGVINGLDSALTEFIPYVVYVGLGILGAIIGFVAIKRLINRVRAKVFGTFNGGKRR